MHTSSFVKLPTRVSSSDSPRGTSTPSVSAHLRERLKNQSTVCLNIVA
jgi:hypothetical protein